MKVDVKRTASSQFYKGVSHCDRFWIGQQYGNEAL